MCRPVTCKKCQKTTWAGCGQHVDQVKAMVPANDWCTCPRNTDSGFLSRFFGGYQTWTYGSKAKERAQSNGGTR